MPKETKQDYIIGLYQKGYTAGGIIKDFGLKKATVYKAIAKYNNTPYKKGLDYIRQLYFEHGYTKDEIINKLEFPKYLVDEALDRPLKGLDETTPLNNELLDYPKLTLKNYVEANSFRRKKNKQELADHFGVDRKTIYRFESRPEIRQYFSRYMELRNNGYCLADIVSQLISIHETLNIFEPECKTTQILGQAIKLLQNTTKRIT